MTDVLSCCKECGNPLPGLVYSAFIKEIEQFAKSNNVNNPTTNITFKSFIDKTDEKNDDTYNKLFNDLMIYKHCCRIRILTYFQQ